MVPTANASEQINIANITSEKFKSAVELVIASSDDSWKTLIKIKSDGGIYNRLNKENLILKNQDSSIVGFNSREGVGIYRIALVVSRGDGSYTVYPDLTEIIQKQLDKYHIYINPKSFVLDRIDGGTLVFSYMGSEVSLNYFDVFATVAGGDFNIDADRLKRSLQKTSESSSTTPTGSPTATRKKMTNGESERGQLLCSGVGTNFSNGRTRLAGSGRTFSTMRGASGAPVWYAAAIISSLASRLSK